MKDIAGTLEGYQPKDLRREVLPIVKQFHAMPWIEILHDNREHLEAVVGKPLMHQREPYMRVLRTGFVEDSVGIHRDTHYGTTAAEWVLWVPLVDAINGAELCILPGSHLEPEEAYPWTQEKGVERYSDDHWLGFMWAPKRMAREVEDACMPVPCRVGQAILFNTACVHGIKVNRAPWTRWSMDVRLVAAGEKTNKHGIHGDIYTPL